MFLEKLLIVGQSFSVCLQVSVTSNNSFCLLSVKMVKIKEKQETGGNTLRLKQMLVQFDDCLDTFAYGQLIARDKRRFQTECSFDYVASMWIKCFYKLTFQPFRSHNKQFHKLKSRKNW